MKNIVLYLLFILSWARCANAQTSQQVLKLSLNLSSDSTASVEKNELHIKLEILKKYYRTQLTPQNLIQLIKNSDFNQLRPDSKDDFLHTLSDEYRGYLQGRSAELKSIFSSKLDKFIYHFLLKNLGYPYKNLTDVTVTTNSQTHQMNVYRLTIDPVTSENSIKPLQQHDFGFYFDLMTTLPLNTITETQTLNLAWQDATSEIKSELKLSRRKNEAQLFLNKSAPNYDDMIKDGIYKGVVLIGSNMHEFTMPTVGNYLKYYMDQGFQFLKYNRNVDTLKYLKENMSGSEPMDFLAKEAHSDGDEKNIFRISLKSRVFRAEKINSKGIKEILEIAFPEEGAQPTRLVSNQEFADWMKTRSQNNGTELIYLNSSCWSFTKALFETAAVNSPLFIDLSSKTVSLTFGYKTQNGTFQVFNGIQQMKSFAEIRENLSKIQTYQNHKIDYYVFPDQATYQNELKNFELNKFDFNIQIQKKIGSQFVDYSVESDL